MSTGIQPGALSDSYTQLKYVLYSWKNSPVLRKDPLARTFFQQLTTSSLPSLLGSPLSLIEGSLRSSLPTGPNKPPELFLTSAQCVQLKAKLSETMGPTRAKQSWKQDADIPPRKMAYARPITFGLQPGSRAAVELEMKLEQLKVLDDQIGTKDSAERLERVREAWNKARMVDGAATFLALDVETWEHDHDLLTEFGWSLVQFSGGKEVARTVEHIVVQENAHRRNGRYCPDARDHFDFGTTRTLPQAQLLSTLSSLFSSSTSTPLYLIAHDPRSDLVALSLLGIPTTPFLPSVPSPPPTTGIFILDSQDLYCGLVREKGKRKLELCASQLDVQTRRLHNAANDAKYTLDIFERMMTMTEGLGTTTGQEKRA
ncbi:hypothetical protein RQP46_010218 [Phenoliferia psychrophenolica]